jgi:hypothetical protein
MVIHRYQPQKEDLRQDVQNYKGMLSALREQRLDDLNKERQSRDVSMEPRPPKPGRSYER